MAEKRVAIRLAAVGGRQVRAEMEGVGEAGSRSFGRLATAAAIVHEMIEACDEKRLLRLQKTLAT